MSLSNALPPVGFVRSDIDYDSMLSKLKEGDNQPVRLVEYREKNKPTCKDCTPKKEVYKKKIERSEVEDVVANFLQFASAYTAANAPDAVLVMDVAYKIVGKKFFRWNSNAGYWDFCNLEQVEKTRVLKAFEKKRKNKNKERGLV